VSYLVEKVAPREKEEAKRQMWNIYIHIYTYIIDTDVSTVDSVPVVSCVVLFLLCVCMCDLVRFLLQVSLHVSYLVGKAQSWRRLNCNPLRPIELCI